MIIYALHINHWCLFLMVKITEEHKSVENRWFYKLCVILSRDTTAVQKAPAFSVKKIEKASLAE